MRVMILNGYRYEPIGKIGWHFVQRQGGAGICSNDSTAFSLGQQGKKGRRKWRTRGRGRGKRGRARGRGGSRVDGGQEPPTFLQRTAAHTTDHVSDLAPAIIIAFPKESPTSPVGATTTMSSSHPHRRRRDRREDEVDASQGKLGPGEKSAQEEAEGRGRHRLTLLSF